VDRGENRGGHAQHKMAGGDMTSPLAIKHKFESWGAVRWSKRNSKITAIVVHHMASTNFGIVPDVWKNRVASAHYGIKDDVIRAYVDENKAAWHSASANQYSIGIECCNATMGPEWKVSDGTFESLVKLCREIQSRRGPLKIIGHRDVAATLCPGPHLYARLDELRNRVNEEENILDTYKTIDDVPGYWREDIRALIKANVVNGGTDNAINDQDVNLTESEAKVLVIMKRYVDSK
jgi:N-acetylmuramoyl-L-alanine amidase